MNIPSQSGKLAIVTGATGDGLGFETARGLAEAGAEVVIAERCQTRGQTAISAIKDRSGSANVRFETLDVANLASIEAFSRRLAIAGQPIDLLVNNAGVMTVRHRQTTHDGFELQFGTNYLGHFALTMHLLPLLHRAAQPRVVSLGSLAHRRGRIDFADLQSERRCMPWTGYNQSKLAILMFAFELQRRSDARGWGVTSIAAHPGSARTNIVFDGFGNTGLIGLASRFATSFFSQSAAEGARPILFAATSLEARKGGHYGPSGFFELKGAVGSARTAAQATDTAACARLWDVSERLTGVSFALPGNCS